MKIFIDQGHNNNGWNTGAVGCGLKEQDITFSVGYKLGERLKQLGVEVKLSRPTKETNLGTNNSGSINARYTMANNWNADYFISIHCNAGGGTGTETLYYSENSKKFAEVVQNTYIEKTGLRSRGIKYRDNLGVLKRTKMPAILVETAFIDTEKDALFLKNSQDIIVDALTEGICKFLNIPIPKKEVNVAKTNKNIKEVEKEMRYNNITDIPDWAKPTIQKLVDKKLLNGSGAGLNLSEDMLRILVINDRAGVYNN